MLQRTAVRSEGTPNPDLFPGVAILSELWGTGVCLTEKRLSSCCCLHRTQSNYHQRKPFSPCFSRTKDLKMHWLLLPGHVSPIALDSHHLESLGLEKNSVIFSSLVLAGHMCLLSCPHITEKDQMLHRVQHQLPDLMFMAPLPLPSDR